MDDEAIAYVHRIEGIIPKGLSYSETKTFYQDILRRARRAPLEGRSLTQVVDYFSEKVQSLEKKASEYR